ncbi:hypothetical protein [Halorarius litoreus]|uniref:hypothetical protein n=1 Tax=Halorarius litoreus TaxID=2962676 RepID=UPI0020CCD0E9|nr:hypothetical protein [Halorarius litoreus]
MPDAYGLFTKGLQWSYREYGLKGAAAFVLLGLVAYYVVNEKLEAVLDADGDTAASDSTPSPA